MGTYLRMDVGKFHVLDTHRPKLVVKQGVFKQIMALVFWGAKINHSIQGVGEK